MPDAPRIRAAKPNPAYPPRIAMTIESATRNGLWLDNIRCPARLVRPFAARCLPDRSLYDRQRRGNRPHLMGGQGNRIWVPVPPHPASLCSATFSPPGKRGRGGAAGAPLHGGE